MNKSYLFAAVLIAAVAALFYLLRGPGVLGGPPVVVSDSLSPLKGPDVTQKTRPSESRPLPSEGVPKERENIAGKEVAFVVQPVFEKEAVGLNIEIRWEGTESSTKLHSSDGSAVDVKLPVATKSASVSIVPEAPYYARRFRIGPPELATGIFEATLAHGACRELRTEGTGDVDTNVVSLMAFSLPDYKVVAAYDVASGDEVCLPKFDVMLKIRDRSGQNIAMVRQAYASPNQEIVADLKPLGAMKMKADLFSRCQDELLPALESLGEPEVVSFPNRKCQLIGSIAASSGGATLGGNASLVPIRNDVIEAEEHLDSAVDEEGRFVFPDAACHTALLMVNLETETSVHCGAFVFLPVDGDTEYQLKLDAQASVPKG